MSGASERANGASERANGRASGPVLTSRFMAVPDHSAPLSESVIEELWQLTEKFALDLGALNIQRFFFFFLFFSFFFSTVNLLSGKLKKKVDRLIE